MGALHRAILEDSKAVVAPGARDRFVAQLTGQLSELMRESRHDLELCGLNLGVQSALVLSQFLSNKSYQVRSSIRHLRLSNNALSDTDALKILGRCVKSNRYISRLDMAHNGLNPQGFKTLCEGTLAGLSCW